jgi:hypothetical protein
MRCHLLAVEVQESMSDRRITARFVHNPPPTEPKDIPGYLSEILESLSIMVNSTTRNFSPMSKEPPKPTNGDMAFADGDDVHGWDPGSGRGMYYYDNGWVKL